MRRHENEYVKHSGFSLIEVMMAISFLGIVLIPLSNMYLASYEGTSNVGHYDQAFNIAQDLMEEISSKDFEDPTAGPGSFGTEELLRIDFDDIDDYNNYGPNSPPVTMNGIAMVAYDHLTRSVSVENIADVGLANMPRIDYTAAVNGSSSFKLVSVTVSWNDGKQSQILRRIIADYQ